MSRRPIGDGPNGDRDPPGRRRRDGGQRDRDRRLPTRTYSTLSARRQVDFVPRCNVIRFGASISGNRPSSPGPNATVETGERAATVVSRARGEGTQEPFSFRFLPFVIQFRATQEVFKEKQALAGSRF
jgi:hypothetical protein